MKFSDYKKKRKSMGSVIDDMKKNNSRRANFEKDERFWELTKDNDYNGEAIVRFLPQPESKKGFPIIKMLNHGFKQNGRWFIENCPTIIGKPCPICEKAIVEYAKHENEENFKNPFYKKTRYIACILVVKDPGKPENEGQIMLWSFGPSIYDKIMDGVAPESGLTEAIEAFDLYDGVNFLIKSHKKDKWPNYSNSKFMTSATPVAKKDKEIEKIFNSIINVDEFLEEDKFKSAEELQKKLNDILGIGENNEKANDKKNKSNRTKDNDKSSKDDEDEEENNEDEDFEDNEGNVDFDSLVDDDDDGSSDSTDDDDDDPF